MGSSVKGPRNGQCGSRESRHDKAILNGEASEAASLSALDRLIPDITQRILSRASRHIASLDILVHSDCVEAIGVANSYYAKQLVTHALLEGMPGVDIRNSLGVRPLPFRDLED